MESFRVLVTGCSGFLGRHVVENLDAAGHEVVGFDLVPPPYSIDRFTRGDFTSKSELNRALGDVDALCHLGGVGDVYVADRDPALAFHANAFGTKVVCDACAEAGVEKLVYASTWEVYGRPYANPVEETHPCNPESSYSISKLAGELFVRSANELDGMKTVALRVGTAYGAWMRESAVISRFIRCAIEGRPLTISGDGSQFRQFTRADDIGRAFAIVVSNSARADVYNVLADETITVFDLARLVADQYGTTIEYGPARPSEPPSVYISAERASRELGWRKSMSFEPGLRRLIEESRPTG